MNRICGSRRFMRRAKLKLNAEAMQVAILKGLCKEMPPTQAIIFMSYFNQFPMLAIRNNQNFFRPDMKETCRQMKLKRWEYIAMTGKLVRLGYLQRRRRKLHSEYRIVFDKLEKYTLKGTT